MGVRWLVNAVLLALPVGTTVGVLLGVDSQRKATGQAPLFNGDSGSGSGSGGGSTNDDRITSTQYCQLEVGISPPAGNGVHYTLNPNQWGYTEGQPGALCMNVTSFNNGTYATNTTAPAFSVTWQYPQGPETQPVHAFPNSQLDGGALPAQLSALQHINLEMQWTYGVGNVPAATTDMTALTQNELESNVAIDMFMDNDKTRSQSSTLAAFEVMVWFATFGTAAQPIGLKLGAVLTEVLNGTTFNLYTGKNSLEQMVLTWQASEMTDVFNGDISPLITKLTSAGNADWPTTAAYLGHLGVGTEAFSSAANVTFSLPVLSVDIQV